MTGWKMEPLRALGTWYGGGTPSKSRTAFWAGGDIPWLSPKDMGADVLSDTRDHITRSAIEHSATRLVPPGAVAMVVRSGILERKVPVAVVPFATTLNQDMKALACRPGVDPRWVAWGLRASERTLLREARKAGTTVASLEWARVLGLQLPIPPLSEQRRVVDILEEHLSRLDAADGHVSAARIRARTLEDRSVLSRLLPGQTLGAVTAIAADALPSLPEEWSWKRLSDIAEIAGGVTKDAKKQSDAGTVEVPYLRVANVQRAHLDLGDVATIRVRPSQAEALRLEPGDVLMNEGGDRDKLARGWVWSGQITGCIHQNHVFRARPAADLVRPEWLAWCANTYGAHWAQRHGRQSVNLASISLSTLSRMPIPVAPLAEQDNALAAIREMQGYIRSLDSTLDIARRNSDTLRRTLMAAAFSGRLTGTSADLEIAEEMAFA